MQPRPDRRTAVLHTAIAWFVMATLPVGTATAGGHKKGADVVAEPAPSGNIVYRPVYPAPRTKALYLSNYAGVVYPPVRARDPLQPTAARRPFARWFAPRAAYP